MADDLDTLTADVSEPEGLAADVEDADELSADVSDGLDALTADVETA